MGKVGAPHGLKGWMRIHSAASHPASLLKHRAWVLRDPDGKDEDLRRDLQDGRSQGKRLYAKLKGVDDIEAAKDLTGAKIFVPRSNLDSPPDGEYYWCDLVGMNVLSSGGAALGEVAEVFRTPANDVLAVRAGRKETLIPFLEATVREVDEKARTITVDWREDY